MNVTAHTTDTAPSVDASIAPPPLKEFFNQDRFRHLARLALSAEPRFDADAFLSHATRDLAALGIMQRMRRTAEALDVGLESVFPGDFQRKLAVLRTMAPGVGHDFVAISLSEFVALRGADHFDLAMEAFRFLTPFGSSEFAVRPFLVREPERTLTVMRGWAEDPDEHARRLASEGSRPRLPWASRLQAVVEDPTLTEPILDRLRADESSYVRRSVANHLNDISKDHPSYLVHRLAAWSREDPGTDWIVRHALRTLIKAGDQAAIALVGAADEPLVQVRDFAVTPLFVTLGGGVDVKARLTSTGRGPQRLLVDYAVHYVKKDGSTAAKVFKLRTMDLAPGEVRELSVRRPLGDFTTRRHYPGRHAVELLVNGRVLGRAEFELLL